MSVNEREVMSVGEMGVLVEKMECVRKRHVVSIGV